MQTINRWWGPGGVLGAVLFGAAAPATDTGAQAVDPPALVVIVDGSGSMWGAFDATRQSKFVVVREALREALRKASPQTRVGLAAFGHRRAGDCADVEILREPESLDADGIMAALAHFNPRGRGPLGLALRESAKSLPRNSGARRLLLIHDDADNCQADVCEVAAELRSAGIAVHVVGIATKVDDMARMACLPQMTGGRHFNAQTAEQVADLVREAVSVASMDGGTTRAPPPQPDSAPLVPPPPIPASGPPALHLRALLAPSTPPLSTPLRWFVAAEDEPRIPLFNAWVANPVVPAAAGRYTVVVGNGLVSARQTIATGQRPTVVTLVLDAGRIQVRVNAQRAGVPLNNAIITISNAGRIGDEKGGPTARQAIAAFSGREASALLPAGRFVVRAELGLVHAEKTVAVSSGQNVPVQFALNAAVLQLTTDGRDGSQPLDRPVFSILEDDPDVPAGRREIARSAARPAEFILPPGTYYAIARQGSIEARQRLAIGPGDVLKRTLTAPAGRLSLSAKATGAAPAAHSFSYTVRRLDETTQEPVTTSERSPVLFFPAGRYRVESRYGSVNVASTQDVEIRAGETQEVVFDHQAATLKLRFTSAGAVKDVFWDVMDDKGRAVWTSAQPETSAILQAGSYRIFAETREKRHERQIDLAAGQNRVVDIVGD